MVNAILSPWHGRRVLGPLVLETQVGNWFYHSVKPGLRLAFLTQGSYGATTDGLANGSCEMVYLLIGLVVYLVTANILITRFIWRDSRRKINEKIAESTLVWIVPFFGHLIALAISLDGPETVRKSDPMITAAGAVAAVTSTA